MVTVMQPRRIFTVGTCIGVLVLLLNAPTTSAQESLINEATLRGHVRFLADDLLEGRRAIVEMPLVGSHELLFAFYGAAIGISYLTGIAVNRRYGASGIGLYRSFAPALRIIVVGSLLSVGIARLNWRFIDIDSSPVVWTLGQIQRANVADWVVFFTMSMLVIGDTFLACALLVPSLRRFAVGCGSGYCGWQAWMGFGEARLLLPVFLVGMYLFLSTESIARIHATIRRALPFLALRSILLPTYVSTAALIGTAIRIQQNETRTLNWLTFDLVVDAAFAILFVSGLLLIVSNLIDYRPKLTWVSFTPRNFAHYLLLAIFLGFLVSPYLGLGNVGRLTAGSGFASTYNKNNHLLLPQASLTKFEQDWVEISDSNDPYLIRIANMQMLMTWYEFVNYVQPRPKTSVVFSRGGQHYQVDRAGEIAELSTSNPWLLRKLTRFQPLAKDAFIRSQDQRMVAQP